MLAQKKTLPATSLQRWNAVALHVPARRSFPFKPGQTGLTSNHYTAVSPKHKLKKALVWNRSAEIRLFIAIKRDRNHALSSRQTDSGGY
jgi:hypothetical protein